MSLLGWSRRGGGSLVVAFVVLGCTSAGDDSVSTTVEIAPSLPPTLPAVTDPSPTTAPDGQFRPSLPTEVVAFEPGSELIPVGESSGLALQSLELFDIDLSLVREARASSTGRIAHAPPGELCVIDVAAEPIERCWSIEMDLDGGSLVWSPDDGFVAGASEFDTDGAVLVSQIEVGTGDVSVVDPGGGVANVAPLYDSAGVLHLFRLDRTDEGIVTEVVRVADGAGEPTGIRSAHPPVGAVVVDGDLAVGTTAVGATGFVVVDLTGVDDTRLVELAPDEPRLLSVIGAANGRALVTSRDLQTGALVPSLLDLRTGVATSIRPELGDGRSVSGLALDPTGTRVAIVVEDRADPLGHRLLVGDIGSEGRVETFAVVATGEEFAPGGGDVTIRPTGIGEQLEVTWVGDQLMYAIGPGSLALATLG